MCTKCVGLSWPDAAVVAMKTGTAATAVASVAPAMHTIATLWVLTEIRTAPMSVAVLADGANIRQHGLAGLAGALQLVEQLLGQLLPGYWLRDVT